MTNKTITVVLKRRNLPHMTLEGSYYFITFNTFKRAKLSVESVKTVLNHIIEGNKKFYHLIAAVILDDHVHIIIHPNSGYELSRIMKGVKGVSSHKINLLNNTKEKIWQDEYYDRIIRDDDEMREKLNYMYNNPIKRE